MPTLTLVVQTKVLVRLFHVPAAGTPSTMLQTCSAWISIVTLRTLRIVARRMVCVAPSIAAVAISTSTDLNIYLARDTLAPTPIEAHAANRRHYANPTDAHTTLPIDMTLQLHIARTRLAQCMTCTRVALKRANVLSSYVPMAMHTSTMLKKSTAKKSQMGNATTQLSTDVAQKITCATLTHARQALCRQLVLTTFHAAGGLALTRTRTDAAIQLRIVIPCNVHHTMRTSYTI